MIDFYTRLGGVVAAVIGLFAFGRSQRAKGKRDATDLIVRDAQVRFGNGRKAQKAGDESGLSPADRVRKNDGAWD